MNLVYGRQAEETHVLSLWPVTVSVHELPVYPHLIDLLQTKAVVPQIRLAETPPMGKYLVDIE